MASRGEDTDRPPEREAEDRHEQEVQRRDALGGTPELVTPEAVETGEGREHLGPRRASGIGHQIGGADPASGRNEQRRQDPVRAQGGSDRQPEGGNERPSPRQCGHAGDHHQQGVQAGHMEVDRGQAEQPQPHPDAGPSGWLLEEVEHGPEGPREKCEGKEEEQVSGEVAVRDERVEHVQRRAVGGRRGPDGESRPDQAIQPDASEDDRRDEQHLVRQVRVDAPKERLQREERRSVPHVAGARQREQRYARQLRP